jgi:type I restriction enzyme M protein
VVRQQEKALAELAKANGKGGKRQNADRATKQLKSGLKALHTEVKQAESSFGHIGWLQERFPEARYEDVTGLCKLADLKEVREQDYSLNPGRYVGVVIEEDGKTEEEFISDLVDFDDQLLTAANLAHELETLIHNNIKTLIGEQE